MVNTPCVAVRIGRAKKAGAMDKDMLAQGCSSCQATTTRKTPHDKRRHGSPVVAGLSQNCQYWGMRRGEGLGADGRGSDGTDGGNVSWGQNLWDGPFGCQNQPLVSEPRPKRRPSGKDGLIFQ